MKRVLRRVAGLMAVALACCTLAACGGDDDDDDDPGSGGSTTTSFASGGKFIAQARCTTGMYTAFTIYKAPAIDIELGDKMVWVYDDIMSLTKDDGTSSIELLRFPGFNGPGTWYSTEVGECLAIVGQSEKRLELHDGSVVEATTNGVRHNGVEYYNKTYFNAHVGEWTGEPTEDDLKAENVTVTMSVKQTYYSRMYRKYEVTVTATGSNFTVKRISVDYTSGSPVFEYKDTQEHSATFTFGITSNSTIVGKVTTSYGTVYKSDPRSI
jgi:hypothetical protein